MATSNGAVFFLGPRAHYQVLQHPDSQYDTENGNTSTETIYKNPSTSNMWPQKEKLDNAPDYTEAPEDIDLGNGIKRRSKRTQSEATLLEREEAQSSEAKNVDATKKTKPRRSPIMALVSRLAQRKRERDALRLQRLYTALTTCTYRSSCRCFDCQSRYFECDESEDYGSSDDDYFPFYPSQQTINAQEDEDDDDDEVFVDVVPSDNTSTDLLLDNKHAVSGSSETLQSDIDSKLQIEVAAGAPVLLTYLLQQPFSCAIQ